MYIQFKYLDEILSLTLAKDGPDDPDCTVTPGEDDKSLYPEGLKETPGGGSLLP